MQHLRSLLLVSSALTLPLLLASACGESASGGSSAGNAGQSPAAGTSVGGASGNGAAGAASGGTVNGGATNGGAAGGGAPSGGAGASAGGSSGTAGAAGASAASSLDLYWIDVEGGAATVIRAPNGKVLLADTGNAGDRDPGRILKVVKNVLEATQIDHVIISHYHGDHVGGAKAVADGIPVAQFIDHGGSLEGGIGEYTTLSNGRRRTVVPGDTVPLGDALLTVVAANASTIATGLAGSAPNAQCNGAATRNKTGEENGASVGYVLSFGKFQFLDLGDLTWGTEHELVCPTNKLGEVDLLQVPHHGFELSAPPQLFSSVNPLVAVISNSPGKGNEPATHERLLAVPALQAVWQIHQTNGNDPARNAAVDRIANPNSSADAAHYIHAHVEADGKFTVENSRNAHSVSYQAR